jgi:predicted nucleotidyltransferase
MVRPSVHEVRLSDSERAGILDAVRRASAKTGVHWRRIVLFGSRAELTRRGGDIDLLVEVDPGDSDGFKRRLQLALEDALGEQKIDVLVDDGAKDTAPFVALARTKGRELWIND